MIRLFTMTAVSLTAGALTLAEPAVSRADHRPFGISVGVGGFNFSYSNYGNYYRAPRPVYRYGQFDDCGYNRVYVPRQPIVVPHRGHYDVLVPHRGHYDVHHIRPGHGHGHGGYYYRR